MTSKPNARSISSQEGFTLLEMIVAVTLVAVMAVGLYGVFSICLRSWARGTGFIDANQHHRSILDLARKQIASAYPLLVSPRPQQGMPQALAPHMIFAGDVASLRFISVNSLQFLESPGLTMVTYEVVQDTKGSYSLVEREIPYRGPESEEAIASQTKVTPIFENLVSCEFDYFDSGEGERPSRWIQEWNAAKEGRLPAAVMMSLLSRDPQGNSLNRHMVVPIQAQVETSQYGMMDPFGGGRTILR